MKKKKKKVKKVGKALVLAKQQIVNLEEQLKAIQTPQGKYSLVESPLQENQLLRLLQRTPDAHVHQRPGKGGERWDYVTGVYIKKVLNYTFGWLWDTDVINSGEIIVDGKVVQIWVDVKLTIKRINPKTKEIETIVTKTQTGCADVKYLKNNPRMPLDYGNDRKSAITDGIKKCASELGIAGDIYGKNEFRDIPQQPRAEPTDVTPVSSEVVKGEAVELKYTLPEDFTPGMVCTVDKWKGKKWESIPLQDLLYIREFSRKNESINELINIRLDLLIEKYIKSMKMTYESLIVDYTIKMFDKQKITDLNENEKMKLVKVLKVESDEKNKHNKS